MNIDEAKKNIETAKRIIGRETEEPGSIWFGIAKSMVGIAEWALGELGAVKRELALTQGACTQHADAEFKARTERDALKLRLETQATAHNERERAWVKEELLDTIESLTRAARSLATQRDRLAATSELKREFGSWPSYQEITSVWFGTESERVCFDGALRVLNLFRKHASTTQSPKPTTPAEAVAVCDGTKSTMQDIDEDALHLAIRTARVVHDRADGPADGTAVIIGSLISAVELLARRTRIDKNPEAPNLWERFQSLLKANNMTTGARPLYMADLRLFSKLLDR